VDVTDALFVTLAPLESDAVGDTIREELGVCVVAAVCVVVWLGADVPVLVAVKLSVTVALIVAHVVTDTEYDGERDRVAN
jgi:hypothetical protein